MQVRDVMTRNVEIADRATTLIEASRRMRDNDIGVLPVCDNGRLIGMVTDRDIIVRGIAEGKDAQTTTVDEVLSEDVFCCFDNQPIEEAAETMRDKQIRRLAVLDQEQHLVGMLSLGDIAVDASKALGGETLQEVSRPSH